MSWLEEMRDPMLAVVCHVGPAHDLDHLSKVITGLCELAEKGSIELQLKPAIGDARGLQKSVVMQATIFRAGQSKEVAFDVHDRSDLRLTERIDQANAGIPRQLLGCDRRQLRLVAFSGCPWWRRGECGPRLDDVGETGAAHR